MTTCTENLTTTTTDGPRIYVASLSDYNAGHLHGAWIDADQDPEDIASDIAAMLRRSPECGAEEYAIHDHDGFHGLCVGEYDAIEDIARLASALTAADKPEALAAFVANGDDVDEFCDAYEGRHGSVEDYAADLVERGVFGDLRDFPAHYVDHAAIARDLELGGDIWTAPAGGGDVYVFTTYR
jgi:antirestriction protein